MLIALFTSEHTSSHAFFSFDGNQYLSASMSDDEKVSRELTHGMYHTDLLLFDTRRMCSLFYIEAHLY